jgi:type III restriction enzyme
VLYFKFPASFKINFPKIIGNYNPDWGIIRKGENGKQTLELIRETKGRTDTENLRFVHEKLKIDCAERHFKAIGIDYRVIDDASDNWWNTQSEIHQRELF